MKPSEVLPKHRDMIRRLVEEAGMGNPRIFGSVIHGDDMEGSDLDILIDAPPKVSLLAIVKLQVELEAMIGIKVDLRTAGFLHPKFRDEVLAEAVPV